VRLARGRLAVEVSLDPLAITVSRAGTPLVENLRLGRRDGSGGERLIQITEGVIPEETWADRELFEAAEIEGSFAQAPAADVWLRTRAGDQWALVRVAVPGPERVLVELRTDPAPFRLEATWDAGSDERVTGLGARHGLPFDQRGRRIRLGADRRYTGPDCPEDMLAQGGIPQGDYVPVPWLVSSGGWALWAETWGPGLDLDLAGAAPLRRACGVTCDSPGCPGSCPSGRMATGRAATSTSTSGTSRRTGTAIASTTCPWTPW
jgi:hypothetical protein